MTEKRDLSAVTDSVTDDELLAVLLDVTGDLDKAQVLRQTLPAWLVEAEPATLAALEKAHADSEQPRRQLEQLLERVQPLNQFCTERLHTFLLSKGVENIDVEHDQLEVPKRTISAPAPPLSGPLIEAIRWEKHSLIKAAMQNFDAAQARDDKRPPLARVRSGKTQQVLAGITGQQFMSHCRELDLGEAYQRHLREVFNLPHPSEAPPPMGLSYNPAAVTIGQSKCLDMQIDLHIACAKEHVSAAMAERLLRLIKADRPASELEYLTPLEKPLRWQGLNLHDACLWSVLVVSDDDPGKLGAGSFLVYMPNEPVRPWYEYERLEDFKLYLRLKLQVASYRSFFAGYLDEFVRLDFFKRFEQDKSLGSLEPLPVNSGFSGFYFNAYVGKVQRDALALAPPTVLVDKDADEARWLGYLETGLDVLNVAALVVPVLGQLMMGVAVGQLLGEVFDGVEDWSHGDKVEALHHLANIGESLAAMAAFAVGGRVVGTLKARVSSADFFSNVEAVTRTDHRPGLWRPRLAPYSQALPEALPWVADSKGVVQSKGQSWVKLDGATYAISYDPGIGKWRINHPLRPHAYRPPLNHNYRGGWQHVFEQPEQWNDLRYNLTRLDPSLDEWSPEATEAMAHVTDLNIPRVRRLALEHEPLPQRFQDCVMRFKQHQKVADLMGQLKRGEVPSADTSLTQMLAIPLIPGWPRGRFIELLDEQDQLLERYPDVRPFDYNDLSVHLTQRQLKDGQVMQTVLQALSEDERSALLGEKAPLDEAPALLRRRLLVTLKTQQQVLTQQLYQAHEGYTQGELLLLKKAFPQLSNRRVWEVLTDAPYAQRLYLHKQGRVPLALAERAREAAALTQEDQAVTGLYLPEQAQAMTRRLALRVMQDLPGWPRELFLQLRQQAVDGEVVAEVGEPTASVRHTLVQTAEGFQAFDQANRPLAERADGALGFYQALVDSVPNRHRAALNLQGNGVPQRLLTRIRLQTQDRRARVAAYLQAEWVPAEPEPVPCIQGAPPALPSLVPNLLRKMRKLYPLTDDTQLAGIVQSAGADHLSRAKAVEALERQFVALHNALEIWRSDRSAHDPSVISRWDYRLSRYQVAKAIEHGWKGMTQRFDHQRRSVPALSLDSMLHDPLPTLPAQVSFEQVRLLSLGQMALTDTAAYFLKHFKNLMSLNLADNRVSRIPQALALMPELEYLCLANNAVLLDEYSRNTLAGLRSLRVLNLSNNPLVDPPDVSRMFMLRELMLRNCRLKEFPKGVSRLPYLENLDLRGNDISVLPEWLFQAPRSYARIVNLRHNPLDARSQQLLREYRNVHGVGMGYLEDDLARLTEQKARDLWLADERVAGFSEKHRIWTGLKDEPGGDGLFTLLAELGGTADTEHVREDMDRRVWRVLDAASQDTQLREEIFERAATPLNCDDAAAVSFSNLEVLVEVRAAARLVASGQLTAEPLLKLARGLFRIDQLERLAYNHCLEHPAADPLEVSLAYRTGLVDRFHLPGQPTHMRFSRLGGVTAKDLDDAEDVVKSAELSPRLLRYLVDLPFWTQYLKHTHAARFEALNEPLDLRLEAVFDQSLTLDDASYREQMNTILQEQVKAERDELERLTQEALKHGDLGGCVMP
ncbi:hypothetical protein KHP07_22560 [Pseudomonas sp. VS40]|uniref:NEL-type E3 ubiquitin ligase domain-containing protein n=1 Tax=unclassified Pseudomonas TaxID=196821 RepID=UPI001BDE70B8|nr:MULTISPECIES: NEL-type E3 ubiquitin ligase domain-containing protein [unclassified Pseudomonas]MBT1263155.1 hypothetical protein [Pseudomonas sp. VS40]MBT1275260.1 hypothetical protein [Pseudomonas sp. VS59]